MQPPNLIRQIKEELAALIPTYTGQGGNATLIITRGGEEHLEKHTITWVFRRLSYQYFLNTSAARIYYGSLLGRSKNIPLPFSPQLTLIPLPLRKARVRGDKITGFLALEAIRNVQAKEKETHITLACQRKIPVYLSSKVVTQRIKEAKLVQQLFHYQLFPAQTPALHNCSGPESVAEREEAEYLTRAFLQILWQKALHLKN